MVVKGFILSIRKSQKEEKLFQAIIKNEPNVREILSRSEASGENRSNLIPFYFKFFLPFVLISGGRIIIIKNPKFLRNPLTFIYRYHNAKNSNFNSPKRQPPSADCFHHTRNS